MSASVTDRHALRTAFVYLVVSVLCAAGGAVYEAFSHSVWSGFMVYAFLFPLAGGALPFSWLALRGKALPSRLSLELHHCGVATLTVGSFFDGALAIYGTSNQLTVFYWIIGPALLIAGLAVYLRDLRQNS